MRSGRPAYGRQQQAQQEENHTETNGGVCQIEVGWPQMDFEEVGDGAHPGTVHQVSERAACDRPERDGAQAAAGPAAQPEDGQCHDHDQGERADQLTVAAEEAERRARVLPQREPHPARDDGRLLARLKVGVRPGLAQLISGGDDKTDDAGGEPPRMGPLLGGYFFAVGWAVADPLPDPCP